MFELRDIKPAAHGKSRLVFAHPTDRNLVIKVMKPEHFEHQKTTWTNWKRPAHSFQLFAREIQEQLTLLGKGEKIDEYLARIHGFCETDFGLGILVQAMRRPSGKLALTLGDLIRMGKFTPKVGNDLDRFCNQLLASEINFGELMLRNILYAADGSGERKFVLVDGYGSSTWFSFKKAFPRLDRRLLRSHRLKRFRKGVDLRVKAYEQKAGRKPSPLIGS